MTPQPKYPYDCPLLLSKEDVADLRQANISLAEITVMLREVQEMTRDSHRTLRGHNGHDGLIARLSKLEEQLEELGRNVDALKGMPEEIESLKSKVDTLDGIPAIVDQWKRYPPVTWLVAHKPKEVIIITAIVVLLAIVVGFPGHAVSEQVKAVIEMLFLKWMKL